MHTQMHTLIITQAHKKWRLEQSENNDGEDGIKDYSKIFDKMFACGM